MKLLPDKLGGSTKQYAILGGLAVLGLISYLVNRTPSGPPATQRPAAVQDPVTPKMPAAKRVNRSSAATRRAEDFKPSLKLPEGMDVSKIDPTIKLALLEKLRNAPMETGTRGSVFQFGQPPPPPPPPKPVIIPGQGPNNPTPTPTETARTTGPAPPPPPPPIPLKFYGYSNSVRGGPKRAFFLDGEDISVVSENDVIRNRYKIIRIGVNSVVVEDLNFKNQQTLPLVAELAG